jgi:ribosomal protein S27AE
MNTTKTNTFEIPEKLELVETAALLVCTPTGIAVAPVATQKRCARCGEDKALSAFNKEKRKKDGLSAWCKACKAADQNRRRVEILNADEDWKARRRTYAQLARLIEKGALEKPRECPQCGKAVPLREMQARFEIASDPFSVVWRCRGCALGELGKSVIRACAWCREPFRAQTHQLRRGAGKYCSVKCRNAWMRKTAEHVRDVEKRTDAAAVFLEDRF